MIWYFLIKRTDRILTIIWDWKKLHHFMKIFWKNPENISKINYDVKLSISCWFKEVNSKRDMFILNNVFKFVYMKRNSKSLVLHWDKPWFTIIAVPNTNYTGINMIKNNHKNIMGPFKKYFKLKMTFLNLCLLLRHTWYLQRIYSPQKWQNFDRKKNNQTIPDTVDAFLTRQNICSSYLI